MLLRPSHPTSAIVVMHHRAQSPTAAGETVLATLEALAQTEVRMFFWPAGVQLSGGCVSKTRSCRSRSRDCTAPQVRRKDWLDLVVSRAQTSRWSFEVGKACDYRVTKWKLPRWQRLEACDFWHQEVGSCSTWRFVEWLHHHHPLMKTWECCWMEHLSSWGWATEGQRWGRRNAANVSSGRLQGASPTPTYHLLRFTASPGLKVRKQLRGRHD